MEQTEENRKIAIKLYQEYGAPLSFELTPKEIDKMKMEEMTNEEIIKEIWKRDVKKAIGKGWRSYSDWFNGMKQYGRNILEAIYEGIDPAENADT